MEKLINNTTKIRFLLIAIILFAACKKDKPISDIDITKYCIAGKYEKNGVLIPFLFTFSDNAKVNLYADFGGEETKSTYIYTNGELKITHGLSYTFKISNADEKIIGLTSEDKSIETYSLVKLPIGNQLNLNTYEGTFKPIIAGAFQYTASLKFNNNSNIYTESIAGNKIDRYYTPINGIAGYSANGNIKSFFVLIDGKLEISYFISKWQFENNKDTRLYGSFNKTN